MNHQVVKQIVKEAFEKVKQTSASHKKNALSNKIEIQSDPRISYKTAERAYEKYIDEIEMDWSPNRVSVNNLCKFLGYDDYKDYIEKNKKNEPEPDKPTPENELIPDKKENNVEDVEDNKNKKWRYLMTIVISSVTIFFIYDYFNKSEVKKENKPPIECMVWAQDHYKKIDCNLQLHPDYGTKVEPYDASRSKMEKKKVNAATRFFSEETRQPLIWYYKTKKGTLEYFNLPGLHPVNGETLKKITKGMIEEYVPIHINKPDSFVSSDTIDFTKTDATNLQDFDKSIFKIIESISKDLNDYDENFQIIIYPFKFNKENEAMLAEYISEEFWIITPKKAVNFEVMDRASFDEYFKEHKLKSEGLIDPKTEKQFGMLIAADAYVTGKVYVFNSIIRLRVTVTDTQTGKIIATQSGKLPITSDIANYIRIKD